MRDSLIRVIICVVEENCADQAIPHSSPFFPVASQHPATGFLTFLGYSVSGFVLWII